MIWLDFLREFFGANPPEMKAAFNFILDWIKSSKKRRH